MSEDIFDIVGRFEDVEVNVTKVASTLYVVAEGLAGENHNEVADALYLCGDYLRQQSKMIEELMDAARKARKSA